MTMLEPPAPGTLQVWTDLSCPYATEALAQIDATRERLGLEQDVSIEHRAFPLQLASPGHPETAVGLAAVLLARDEQVGGPAASEALDRALRASQAWTGVEEVLDVARGIQGLDADALAARLGDAEALVAREWEAAQAVGIEGSPHVRLADGTSAFNPGEADPQVWDELLRRALSPEG